MKDNITFYVRKEREIHFFISIQYFTFLPIVYNIIVIIIVLIIIIRICRLTLKFAEIDYKLWMFVDLFLELDVMYTPKIKLLYYKFKL